MNNYRVTTALRLRRSGEILKDNIITVLPKDTIVTEIGASVYNGWLNVSATISNQVITGYISSSYAEPVPADEPAPEAANTIKDVHMPLRPGLNININSAHGRAYPLNQQNMPFRGGDTVEAKVSSIYAIIDFLNVEKSKRYLPGNGVTFCNIYSYDFCYLSKSYMPRVWWTGKSIELLSKGQDVPVKYGETVTEINANMLYDWFSEYGDDFGWKRVFDADLLQAEVNKGKTGIIVAKRKVLSRSGHIVPVIPEKGANKAVRSGGVVTIPLQSQAGVKNKKVFASSWYFSSQFSAFGFWVHD